MSTDMAAGPQTATPTDPQELRAEIARTRAELGETVAALADKTDVKSRAQRSAARAGARMKQRAEVARLQAGALAAGLADRARVASGTARHQFTDGSPAEIARRPIPVATVAAVVSAAAVVALLIRRHGR
ncbi:DUF3618 domain-containing protein [Mangrovihabitans endophyticus]|uniref:DUF3618 domain-containing protein n=1 Tax=Mangrovihabitans endophyticus TaxID=1751298 RepID=A0A8J3C268_9ACTN|nr:DUF3618 domain-containing protein [Mangrovihabitans endophyticus]GGL08182.1 hypothetical protein GCM10012284_48320 [Mangrovihabitans endophyticus]